MSTATNLNVDRLIVGFATLYDQRSRNGVYYKAEHFEKFLSLEPGIPLRVDHGPLIRSNGCVRYVGMVRRFASVRFPAAGLLVAAEVDEIPGWTDELLADIGHVTSMTWLDPGWHLSLAAHVLDDLAWPYEVSLTMSPAFPDARILAIGERAIEVWDLLTEKQITQEVA